MILHKFWSAFIAQINKVANLFWEADPVAQMRYEYDRAVEWSQWARMGTNDQITPVVPQSDEVAAYEKSPA